MTNICYLRDSSGSIKPEYLLPLTLYILEKQYHFSGNGVWNTSEKDKDVSISKSPMDVFEDKEDLDHKPSANLF